MLTWKEHNSDSTYTGSPSSLAWATKKLPFFGWSCKSVRQVKSKLSDTISFNLHVTGWTYFHSVLPCRQRQPPERNLSLLFAFHLKFEAIVALSLFILLPKTRSHSRPITLLFTPQSWQKTACFIWMLQPQVVKWILSVWYCMSSLACSDSPGSSALLTSAFCGVAWVGLFLPDLWERFLSLSLDFAAETTA